LDFEKQGKYDQGSSTMRNIVIIAEMVLFAPALLFLLKTMYKDLPNKRLIIIWAGVMSLAPAIFIDHGHYQFN
jgi:glycopeptide antibiotics resistance protein